MTLQVTCVPQPADGTIKVTFATPYSTPPVVIVTPYWKDSPSPIREVITVTDITTTDCTIISENASPTFFLNVLSVDENVSQIDQLKADAGFVQKTTTKLTINFGTCLSSPDPVILVTPFWKGSKQSVGRIDTIDDSSASECSIISGNLSPTNYFTNYVAMDLGAATINTSQTLQNGIVNKIGRGTQRVYFSKPFKTAPTVMLSPWWNDANDTVGSIETLTSVSNYYFEFTSENVSQNYFVNWVAVGN
jgi:hypothetical protein